ncbi:10017_t:CDS:2, partial [Cetraspora pellucida]
MGSVGHKTGPRLRVFENKQKTLGRDMGELIGGDMGELIGEDRCELIGGDEWKLKAETSRHQQ